MKIKKILITLLIIAIILGVGYLARNEYCRIRFSDDRILAVCHDVYYVGVEESIGWCRSKQPNGWYEEPQFTVVFLNNQSLTVESEGEIIFNPEIIKAFPAITEAFAGYDLAEGFMLVIRLDDGSIIRIIRCEGQIYANKE